MQALSLWVNVLKQILRLILPNFESKSKGIVIRYRIISVGRYLLTIKLKRQNNHYQEYVELEYSSNSNDNLAFLIFNVYYKRNWV